MPKIINHEERRDHIVRAVWRLIERQGVSSLTVRDIAKEAQSSVGVLSHYFSDKAEIMEWALKRAHKEVFDYTGDPHAMGARALRNYLEACLPVDDGRMQLAIVEVSFWGLAIGEPSLSAAVTAEFHRWKGRVRELIEGAVEGNELAPAAMKNDELLDRLRLVMDGATFRAASGEPLSAERQLQLLDWAIDAYRVGD